MRDPQRMYSNKPRKYLSVLVVGSIIFFTFPSAAEVKPRTKCNIRVDNPHISKSIKRYRGFRAVKVNARSKCNIDMSNLRLTVEIYKKGLIRDHKVKKDDVVVDGLVPRNVVVKNQDTWEKCISSKRTTYYGIAYATAIIAGKSVSTPRAMSLKSVSLNCGT